MVYEGDRDENHQKHGFGINTYDNGEVYEGNEWQIECDIIHFIYLLC